MALMTKMKGPQPGLNVDSRCDTKNSFEAKAFLPCGVVVICLRTLTSRAESKDIGQSEAVLVQINDKFLLADMERHAWLDGFTSGFGIRGIICVLNQFKKESERVIVEL